ncbi:translocation and assembly module lipoprotein TamL [Planktosalinus lacus]|uniref:Membrane protein n=1 Tax=Planktosalinus lacus TaxID=1526573 RepID=A0A8J2V8X1_9FLAO|nr:BamA/TamA family outer membrane protein [Planktosalinus lacus]GGD89004.1 membrane protein [Planktosalinus lacus]
MKKLFAKIPLFLLTLIILSSCDAVKKVSENDFLLTKNTILIDDQESSDAGAYSQIIQEPNSRLLTIPIALHFYNLASEKTDSVYYAQLYKTPQKKKRLVSIFSQKQVDEIVNYKVGFNNWIKSNGEAPVVIRKDRAERSKERIEEYYKSFGWLNAKASYEIIEDTLKEKRASIIYKVERQQPYFLDSIVKKIDSPIVDSLFKSTERKSLIRSGQQYSRNNFADERDRVTVQMRNSGLFHFNQEAISFISDTVNTGHKANIEYLISDRAIQSGDTTLREPFKIHKVQKIKIITDYSFENRNKKFQDSVNFNGYTLYSYDKMSYRPKAITDAVFIEPGGIFKDTDRTLTYNHLSELRVFRYPNISYEIDPADSTDTDLIATILLTPRKKFGANFDVDVSTSNIQDIGIGFSTSFLTRNVFKGAETLEISVRGSIGSSKDVAERDSRFFNLSEVGGDVKLGVPRILFPLNTEGIIPKYMSPYTNLSVGASSQSNIGLDKQTTNLIWNYKWSPSRIHTYRMDLANVQYIRNLNTGNYFNVYKNSYDRLNDIALENSSNINPFYFNLDDNNNPQSLIIPEGAEGFLNDFNQTDLQGLTEEDRQTIRNINQQKDRLTENNLIFASNISWIRDSRQSVFDNQFSRIRLKLEFAGNLLAGVSSLAGIEKNNNDNYEVFNVTFSQYVKFDGEYVRYWEVNKQTQVAMRLFGGIAIPYGNSNSIPFSRSYFAGGPNDNRGWLPFKLGPGASDRGDEFNEANFKLAANIEYRFTILGSFKGALFVDAGNIWNALDNITDEKSTFEEFSDLKNVALGSGFGLRYDFGFFVLRGDLGFKTYNPAREEGDRWFKEYNFSNTVLNIGINYPF